MPQRNVRTPQEKKRLSLDRDRRNVYGENDKSSRRNIPRNKQVGQRMSRRAVSLALSAPIGDEPRAADELAADAADAWAGKSRSRFKKLPDAPLGEILEAKRRRDSLTRALAIGTAVEPARTRRDPDAPVRTAAIQEFCASSSVLRASDVTWGESGMSATGLGRRYRVEVTVKHLPTETEVRLSSQQAGGHTRKQAQRVRSALYTKALRNLETQVTKKVREMRRQERAARHRSHPN